MKSLDHWLMPKLIEYFRMHYNILETTMYWFLSTSDYIYTSTHELPLLDGTKIQHTEDLYMEL